MNAAISQTLQNLNTNAESLQNPFSDQDIANMFSNFNLAGEEGQVRRALYFDAFGME